MIIVFDFFNHRLMDPETALTFTRYTNVECGNVEIRAKRGTRNWS